MRGTLSSRSSRALLSHLSSELVSSRFGPTQSGDSVDPRSSNSRPACASPAAARRSKSSRCDRSRAGRVQHSRARPQGRRPRNRSTSVAGDGRSSRRTPAANGISWWHRGLIEMSTKKPRAFLRTAPALWDLAAGRSGDRQGIDRGRSRRPILMLHHPDMRIERIDAAHHGPA